MKNNGEILKVNTSTDYNKFKFLPGNRTISSAQVAKLKNSLKDCDLSFYKPIIVNDRMQIIDGQHIFTACKETDLPIRYVIIPGASIQHVKILNMANKGWSGYDFINMYAMQGKKPYQELKEFIEKWRLNIWDAILLLTKTMGQNTFMIQNGHLSKTDIESAEKIAGMIYDFSKWTDQFRSRAFVRAFFNIYKNTNYNHARMIKKCEQQNKKFPYFAEMREVTKRLENIYNIGEKDKTNFPVKPPKVQVK